MITAKPDVKKKSLDKIELLVIGCDGVWEIKTNEEVGQMIYDQAIKKKQNLVKVV
jgi:serine/threonine protein phosphatase PrpC